jgi:uncharacterized protein (DUF4415 family)
MGFHSWKPRSLLLIPTESFNGIPSIQRFPKNAISAMAWWGAEFSLSGSRFDEILFASLALDSGGKEQSCMKTTTKKEAKHPVLFAPDGYELADAPADLIDSMEAGEILPRDFLPPPSELLYKPVKKMTTIRLDADVLDWFKSMGKGYQSRINAVLRAYKSAHQD